MSSTWENDLSDSIYDEIRSSPTLRNHVQQFPTARLHLVILKPQYLRQILDGRKSVEVRLSVQRRAPFQKVHVGDLLILKQSGGPVVAVCDVSAVEYAYINGTESLSGLRSNLGSRGGNIDDAFWEAATHKKYASLVHIGHVTRTSEDIAITKRDQRSWVVMSAQSPLFTM